MLRPSSLASILLASPLFVSCGSDDTTVPPIDAGTAADLSASDAGSDAGPASVDASDSDATPPGDTWTTFAEPFFVTYCVDCHSVSPKNFNLIDDVRALAPRIRCGVSDVVLPLCTASSPSPRQFPIGTGPRPTAPDRARLAAWIDAGLLE